MPLRGRPVLSRLPRLAIGTLVLGVSLALSASTVEAIPLKADRAELPGIAGNPDPVSTKKLKAKKRAADPAKKAATKALDPAVWPSRQSAEIPLTPSGKSSATAKQASVTVGGLPVTATAIPTGKSTKRSTAPPSRVRVTSLGETRARTWDSAALLSVVRADTGESAAPVELTLDYSAFAEGAGGAFGSRLQLLRLPVCAATARPGSKSCPGLPERIPFKNDNGANTLTARVTAAPAAGETAVYALAAGESSSKGNYKATGLAPSASWNVSHSSGGFSWDYPIRSVPTPGGLTPSVGLGYSSQSADGRTSATNNQGSWIGEGFSYEPGYIERSYKPCAEDGHSTSAEQCWAFENATIMLGGSSGELVKDDVTNEWHISSESGSKVVKRTSTDEDTGNGDNNGEHWVVTTTDGTEYWFGRNKLPGWTTGKEETASTWTAPVFGDDSGEPCYNATFANAHCKQAWRWNLDYVKDARGNVMSYYYGTETNHYALNGKTDVNGTPYIRGGYLKRIDYGQRAGAVHTTKPPARVVFNTAERCIPDASFDCAESKFTTANAARWPDTPVDRFCKVNTKCGITQTSQTFWTNKRLTGITTQMSTGPAATAWGDVDAWTFTHFFTDNGDDTKTLWLQKIDHQGRANHNGQGGAPVSLPSLLLGGMHLRNRVDSPTDNIDAINRYRLAVVTSETGAQLDVTYAPTECTPSTLPTPGNSTKRCYPVKWMPPGAITEKTDWFHKYVVGEISETDRTGGGTELVTSYDYKGSAGWRHAEWDGITDKKFLTWGQWQGYGQVTVVSGSRQDPRTKVDYTYLQGLHGDKLPAPGTATRTEQVTDSTNVSFTGHKEYSGFELESKTYDLVTGGKVIAKTISEPWKHDTATQTRAMGANEDPIITKATFVKSKVTRGYALKADNTWRETKSISGFETAAGNRTGRLTNTNDLGDLSTSTDDTCTRLWYADNTALNIMDLPSRSQSVSVDCNKPPEPATNFVKDERTFYDGLAYGAAPTRGEATRTERLTGYTGAVPNYQHTGTTAYDSFGRPTDQWDGDLNKTETRYTDANGLISQTRTTNALGHLTTTDYAPAWGSSTGQTDPNGKRTDLAYDAMGRLTSVWLANRVKTLSPSIKYSYNVRSNDVVAIKTEKLENDSTYGVEYQLYDSFLRPRQKQTEGPNGSRMIGEVFYDGAGKIHKVNETFNALGAPADTVATVVNGDTNGQNLTEHDALGRPTAQIFRIAGVEQWRTTTQYDGERTHVDPPTGSRPTTTITDARGKVTEVRHYTTAAPQPSGPGSQYDTTKYTYTKAGQLATVTDAQQNVWTYEYDRLGRKTKSIDPDAGTSTTTYDNLDRPVTTSDGRENNSISTVYDALGRVKTTWDGAPTTGTKLTETYHDKAGWLGHPWASLRYVNATQYFATVTKDMDAMYRPEKVDYTVPTTEGTLAGTYTFTTTYNPDGTVKGQGMPAAGSLTGEAIAFSYDDLQRPTGMTGTTSYVTDVQYTPTSQVKGLHLYTGTGRKIQHSLTYERGTDRLTRSVVDIEGITGPAKAANYSYDQAGNVLSIADTSGLSPDVQCFGYTGRQTLAEAWTPAATVAQAGGSGTVGGTGSTPTACTGSPGTKPLGGPAPYWKSYETDAIGNRLKDVTHDTTLDTTKDVTRTYTYGEGTAGPHALTKVVDSATPTKPTTFVYDKAGNLDARTTDSKTQDFQWDVTGKPAKIVEADGTVTESIYDASGSRVLRRDKTATTVYLPGMELRLPKNTTTVEATRYYGFAGQTIAVRQNSNQLTFLLSDHHGTGELAINAATSAVSQRRFDPYGITRGQNAGVWPGEKGFVGGTIDESTGLTHIGAREYDAKLGRFISVDPVIDHSIPAQLNAYAYAFNSPVTLSDPSGLTPCAPGKPGWICKDQQTDEDRAEDNQNHAQQQVDKAKGQQSAAKKRMKQAGKALVKIVKELIGVDAAMDCFSSGDLSACGETLLNVAGSFAGGLAGKILAKYGTPWNWSKGAKLVKTVTNLVGDLLGGMKSYAKASGAIDSAMAALDKANAGLKVARAKAKVAKARADAFLEKVLKSDPGCHSFLPGTLVLLADGTKKPIEDVKPGERVVVTDPETGETTTRDVADTIRTEDDKEFVDLALRPESGKLESLVSTTTHPFWVKSQDKWVKAGDLWPGMKLRTPDGDTVTVEGIRYFEKRQRTHDLSIEDIHTYYVLAGATPILVHNCGESAVKAAQGVANASASIRPSAARPAVAEAIRLPSGRVIASASVRGVQVRLHPAVSAVLSTVAPGARGVGHGQCGLAVCISQALFTGESPMGADAAAVIIRGNVEHPKHGFPVGPCDSCRSLSEHFKLNFVTDD